MQFDLGDDDVACAHDGRARFANRLDPASFAAQMSEDDPRFAEARQLRLDQLRSQIAARLAAVCAHWPTEMFEEMVRGLAALTYKYERHPEAPSYDRRSTDRLLDDMKSLLERSVELRNTPRSQPSTMQERQETD